MNNKKFALLFTVFLALTYILVVYSTFSIMYPLKYIEQINSIAHKNNISSALVLSIIKVESNFNSYAISSVGAQGLMQLMPNTAKYIAQKIGYENKIDLFDTKCNITLGVAYIDYLQNIFEDFDSMICAYNAGEGVVKNWQKDDKGNLIIEYKETENYLQNIKIALSVYSKKVH